MGSCGDIQIGISVTWSGSTSSRSRQDLTRRALHEARRVPRRARSRRRPHRYDRYIAHKACKITPCCTRPIALSTDMPPYNSDTDYGDGYSAQVTRDNEAKYAADKAKKQAAREAAYLQRFQRGTFDANASHASSQRTGSNRIFKDASRAGRNRPYPAGPSTEKRAAKRAAARAEAEKPAADTRTSAQKLADRFGLRR